MSGKLTAITEVGGIHCNVCSIKLFTKTDFDKHYQIHSNEIQYTCAVCKKEFSTYSQLRGHCYSSHVIQYTYKCDQCPSIFKKQFYLTQHINKVHKFTFKCQPPCTMKFATQKELLCHQIIHKAESLNCKICNMVLPSLNACEAHLVQHVQSKYTCPICSETFTNKLDASQHITVHFEDETYTPSLATEDLQDECSIDVIGGILCNICSTTMKNRQECECHFFSEHMDEPLAYACPICSKSFELYELFQKHCYDHVAKEKFRCDTCNLCFIRPSTLVAHKMSCTGSVQQVWSCNKCTHTCSRSRLLIIHKREAHNEVESYLCLEEGCGKKFENGRDLAVHKMSHTDLANWCRGCGLKFTTINSCIDHLEAHKKSIYICTICDAEYIEKHNFTKHILKHYATTLHVCNQCGKTFTTRHRLIEHTRTHSTTKPFVCEYCARGFVKLCAYKQHLNIHLQQKPFECSVCKRTFSNYPNMCKHLRRSHKIDPKTKQPLDNNNKVAMVDNNKKQPNENNKKVAKINSNKMANQIENEVDNVNIVFNEVKRSKMKVENKKKPNQIKNEIDDVNFVSNEVEESKMSKDKINNNVSLTLVNDSLTTESVDHINLHYPMLPEDTNNKFIKIETITYNEHNEIDKTEDSTMATLSVVTETFEIISEDVKNSPPSIKSTSSMDSYDYFFTDTIEPESQTYSLQKWSNTFPAEYGPDFIEEHYLPHINPALTTTAKSDEDLLLSNKHLEPLQQFDSEDLHGLNMKWDSRLINKFQFDIPF